MILGKDSAADYVLLALLILYPLVEWRWYWPRVSRALRAGIPGARTSFYRTPSPQSGPGRYMCSRCGLCGDVRGARSGLTGFDRYDSFSGAC